MSILATRPIGTAALALCALLLCLLATCAHASDYYTSPAGSDANTGSGPAPAEALRTVQAGVSKLRLGDTLHLGGGMHFVRDMITLGQQASGTADRPTTIRAYKSERPVLVGATEIRRFVPHRGSIVKADLAANGLKGKSFNQIFLDGKRQIMARYPNFDPENPITGGWAYVDRAKPPADTVAAVGAKRVLRYKSSDVRRWANPTQGRVFIFPCHEWWNNIVPIAAHDPANNVVTLKRKCSYEIKPEDRYYVMGLLEELDAPGEWCVDAAGETLYFWPPSPLGDRPVYVPTTRTILELDVAKHVTVQGLTLQYCGGTAIRVKDCDGCLVAGCTIRNVGDYHGAGVSVTGGKGNGAVGCDISDTGHAGIKLSGGVQRTRTPAGNYAENNHITRTGVFYKQGSGISVSGVGNRVARNTIHHVPRWCIQFGGNDHTIELNHLHHASLETSDTGAVYGGSLNWLSGHGIVIRHNYIHDVVGCGRRNGEWRRPFYAWGIYLDWTAMGVTVHGNIVARAPRAGIMVHDGRFNVIENNVIVDCGFSQYGAGSQIEFSGWHTKHFFWKRGHGFGWIKQYESVANQAAWHRKGSTLRDPRTTALPDGRTMHSNVVRRNILCYRDPKALSFRFRNVSFEHNPSDHNLIWHYGELLRTGLFKLRETTGPNLVPNAGIEDGPADTRPPGWWVRLPWKQCRVEPVAGDAHSGKRSLRVLGLASPALAGKPDWLRQVAAQTRHIKTVEPGKHYRLTTWMKAAQPGTLARIEALTYRGGAYDVRPGRKEVIVGTEWQQYEVAFRFPQHDDGNYHAGMNETFYIRVILRQDEGELWIDDMELREATAMDEWEAWQADGMDRHSIVADPQFVDPANDDYRLRASSPALGLGFERIPTDKIGCYQSPPRASWPIAAP